MPFDVLNFKHAGGKCDQKCEGGKSCRQVGKRFFCVCKQGKKGESCEENGTRPSVLSL